MRSLQDLKELARYASHLTLVEASVPHHMLNLPRKILSHGYAGMVIEKPGLNGTAGFFWPRAAKLAFHVDQPNRFTMLQADKTFTYDFTIVGRS